MMKALWNKVKDRPLAVWRWVFAPYSAWSRRRKLGILVFGLIFLLVLVDQLARWFPIPRASLGPVLGPLFYLDAKDAPAWKDRVAAFGLGFSALVGFALWHWRDVNARATIENARKDVNLKEFQEIQLRAVGALDREKLGEEACEQLQIAALHQLRGFLRGEYGEAFKRPAFELLLAGHAAAIKRIGLREKVEDWKEHCFEYAGELRAKIDVARGELSAADRERLGILRDEAKAIVGSGFPLNGRVLDLVDWREVELGNRNLSGASLIGAGLCEAGLAGANLRRSRLEGAVCGEARLVGANLWGASLLVTNFGEARLEGADLRDARLHLADLSWARLEGADLRGAGWEDAGLYRAVFDDSTKPVERRTALTGEEAKAAQEVWEAAWEKWRAKGTRHVRDLREGGHG